MKIKFFIIFILIIQSVTLQSKDRKIDLSMLREGDIIFQETKSDQAKAIKLATHSKYTHVGIIFKYKNNLKVLEAVQPVSIISIESFINRGVNRHYVIKRLKEYNNGIPDSEIEKIKKAGSKYIGKNYDIYFEWSDKNIYCSELVWKIYKETLNIEVGKLQKLKDFDLSHSYVKKIMKKRHGDSIPFEEQVISPQSMFESGNLFTVMEN